MNIAKDCHALHSESPDCVNSFLFFLIVLNDEQEELNTGRKFISYICKTLFLSLPVTFDDGWIRDTPMNLFGITRKNRTHFTYPITNRHNVIESLPHIFSQMLGSMSAEIHAKVRHHF